MQSPLKIHKDHIIFYSKKPATVEALFPNAKVAPFDSERHLCAVPHTLDACKLFNNMGQKISGPITTGYDWPGLHRPYPHQEVTANFLTLNPRSFCLNGMGSGKTKSALWAVDYLMRQGEITKCLIVCPLSTLDRVWADEIFKTLPHRRYTVLHGTRAKRLERLADERYDFYIINHDGVGIIADSLGDRQDINHIIIDEIAVLRNRRTQKWRTMNEVLNYQHARTVWGLTGTPTPNEPTDAYAQSKLLCPSNYKGSFTSFKQETMWQVTQFKWVPKKGAEDKVNTILKPSIRYALEDCIELPETIHQDRTCDLSKNQRDHFNDLMKEAVTTIEDVNVTAVNAGVLLNKLVQAACGVVYGPNKEILELDFGPRLSVLQEIIEECNEKVIVFVPLTSVLESLDFHLKKQHSTAIVDGSVSKNKRNQIFRDFQNSENPRVLLANAGTMAHGLNLTAASTIVWYAPISSNDIYNQANARIVRPGQTQVTNIIRMYATPMERRMYQALAEKTRLQDIVLELAKKS